MREKKKLRVCWELYRGNMWWEMFCEGTNIGKSHWIIGFAFIDRWENALFSSGFEKIRNFYSFLGVWYAFELIEVVWIAFDLFSSPLKYWVELNFFLDCYIIVVYFWENKIIEYCLSVISFSRALQFCKFDIFKLINKTRPRGKGLFSHRKKS